MNIPEVPAEPTVSGWYATLGDVAPATPLSGSVECDWLVVGGGWMGLHAARRLAELEPDDTIVLVDAGRIGNNAAGRCAGFAIDLAHNPRKKDFAEDEVGNREEKAVNVDGIAYIRDAIQTFGIRCGWSPQGKIHSAASVRGVVCLDGFAHALDRLGEPYEWYDTSRMRSITGSEHYIKGLYTPGTDLMQPAAYLCGAMENLPGNVSVYEDTPVIAVGSDAREQICQTPQGEIRAARIILAINGLLSSFGYYPGTAIPLYTYASLTRPLSEVERQSISVSDPFGLIPADPFGTTMRLTADHRLFIRNIYSYVRNFRSTPAEIVRARKSHQMSFDRRYPSLSAMGFEHSWGGALCLAENGGMVFGQLAARVFGVAFCNGTGVARGAAFGKAIAELATERESPIIDILKRRQTPNRLPQFLNEIGVRAVSSYRLWRAGQEV